jgi:hypothetical protein
MTPLPGTPPLSEREAWIENTAKLLIRVAALEADSAEAFARWYFIDCQGNDLGTADKWLRRFRERRDG